MSNCILAYPELVTLLDNGVMTRADYDLINSASVDIRLGEFLQVERGHITLENTETGEQIQVPQHWEVSLKDKDHMNHISYSLLRDGPFRLAPGEFILAQSYEMFNLPNTISAEYKLKSSMARLGLEHLNAGWCDAGWHGSVLTLELRNMTRFHTIVLHYMDKIGQMVFFKHTEVPEDRSYAVRGRYNNDKTVSGVKLSPTRSIVFGDEREDEEQDLYDLEHPAVTVEFIPRLGKNVLVINEEEEAE
jgi:dCTP deaminase